METSPIGIITALPEERKALRIHDEGKHVMVGSTGYEIARLAGYPIAIAESKCGKVAAAQVATVMLTTLGCKAIIFSGVAGAINRSLKPGDVVIGRKYLQHDYGLSSGGGLENYRPGELPMLEHTRPAHFDLSLDIVEDILLSMPGMGAKMQGGHLLKLGLIVTGDQFVADPKISWGLLKSTNADVVDMESAAVAQVCDDIDVPFVAVRCVTDLADAKSPVVFANFLVEAAINAAIATTELLPILAKRLGISPVH